MELPENMKTVLKEERIKSFVKKGSTVVYKGHLALLKQPYKGKDFDIIVSNDACVIMYIDEDDNVWLTKEYRVPMEREVFGLPAETLDNSGETLLERAVGGLHEECGIKVMPEQFEYVMAVHSTEGHDTELVHLFLAKGPHEYVGQQLGETESITITKMPFHDVYKMMEDGELKGSKTAILLKHEMIRRLKNKEV